MFVKILKTLYTVQKISKDDRLIGLVHGSKDSESTVCDIELSDNWFILTNDFSGNIECKKCLEKLKGGKL